MGSSAALNYHQFFDEQAPWYCYFGSTPVYTDVAQLAARESAHDDVYVVDDFHGHPAFIVLTRGKDHVSGTRRAPT